MSPSALVSLWKKRAEEFRRFGADAQARTFEELAGELDAALEEEGSRLLSPQEVAEESGYSLASIQRMLRERKIPNEGTADEPLVRRYNVPRKPGHGIVAPMKPRSVDSKSQMLRAALNGGR